MKLPREVYVFWISFDFKAKPLRYPSHIILSIAYWAWNWETVTLPALWRCALVAECIQRSPPTGRVLSPEDLFLMRMDATQSSLGSPPGPKTRLAIIERFWNKRVLNDRLDTYGAYFRYYELESKRLYLGVSKRDPDHGALAATTHEDITFVVTALSKGRNSRRREIRQTLQSRFPHSDDLAIDESINLALRLWLMLNVLDDHQNVHLKQTPAIQWNEQATLVNSFLTNSPTQAPPRTRSLITISRLSILFAIVA